MQTRTYGDLFKLIQSLAGVSTFAPTETDDIANLINRRYSEAYQTIQMWPRYIVSSEQRSVYGLNVQNAIVTTASGNYIILGQDTSGFNVYQVVGGTNVHAFKDSSTDTWKITTASTATLATDGTYSVSGGVTRHEEQDVEKKGRIFDVQVWSNAVNINGTLVVSERNLIPYAETGKNTIGEFIRVHRNRAFLNNSSLEYDFFVDGEGANILNISSTTDASAFITYKKVFTPFTTSENFTTSTEEVPSEFFHYIAHAAYSDFLRMDGQHDKAQLEQQNAQQYLALELERVDVIMNQTTVNKRFSTYVNRQSR